MYARQFVTDNDDCEEIVQSFFTNLWEKREKIEVNSSVKSYLFSSIKNRCINHLKHLKIKEEHQQIALHEAKNNTTPDNFLEPGLIEKIYRSIEELPDRRKEIFKLNREHGLKYREIAEKLDVSMKTVEAQMGHALRELREKLKDYKQLLIQFLIFKASK
jgi:RNA polymerase sigma-70 factor (ECF subfamily)